ncbi:MAG TPA: aldo/keto reductase [Pseudolabrys sp.]|nr:aldo/keto reductase [Pseudolabrys sp.]
MSSAASDRAQGGRRFALGTVQFGLAYGIANEAGQVSFAEAAKIVALATEGGIDTVDTAIGYGDSERYLGEIGMTGFNVVTKLSPMPAGLIDVAAWVNAQIDASVARLGIAQVHGVLLHRPQELLGPNGQALFKALCGLKEKSLTRKIGVSIYSPAELESLTAKFRFDLVQAPLNLLDRRLATTGWLQRLKDHAIEVHTRSAFLQGLLLLPRHGIPAKFVRWNGLWDRWHAWLESHKEGAVRACLAYPLSLPGVDRIIIGTDSAEQLQNILTSATLASKVRLPDLACDDEDLINPARWPNL